MKTIQKIDPISTGKILGVLYAFFGLLIGIFISLLSLAGSVFSDSNLIILELIFGAGAFILLPLFYGVIGFISGIFMAFVYNIIASKFGGIKLEIK